MGNILNGLTITYFLYNINRIKGFDLLLTLHVGKLVPWEARNTGVSYAFVVWV